MQNKSFNYMAKLKCRDYGFDCNFEIEDHDVTKLIENFGNHTALEHGKKFEKESLMQFIVGSEYSCPYCNSKFETKEILSKHIDKIHHDSGVLEGM